MTSGVFVTVAATVLDGRAARRPVALPSPTPTPSVSTVAPVPTPTSDPPVPRVAHSPTRPVIDSNFPDPTVLRVGSTYYAYATNDGPTELPIATAPTVNGPWKRLAGDGLPRLPGWAVAGRTWAPEVIVRMDGGTTTYVLYFAARRRGQDKQCIGVATATAPQGPFVPVGDRPLVCPLDLGGAIDPASFVDGDGTRYLLYKTRGHYDAKRPAAIFLQRLTPDALRLVGPPRRILARDSREPVLVEAPELVRRNGKYVLFYAAGWYFQDTYETRYAVATSIGGPYVKGAAPVQSTGHYRDRIVGPGSVDVVSEETGQVLVFHGILKGAEGDTGLVRGMYTADLGWMGDRPVVRGAAVPYEAEHGRRGAGLEAYRRPRASGRRVVGPARGRENWLELRVYAPGAGRYSVRIVYADRSERPVRPALSVNGGAAATVPFRRTAPGRWVAVTVHREFRDGWNVLRLRHIARKAEVDRIEIA
ncbi:family 43 glycosylhydrolase [Thermomonospora umbrina]|uniref:family 43 glycosylhydrolase n=1 Tax=Thermomonospora umbrina TaxID=111806 RepID=UPI0014769A48|nr:family 43 glycosylhydrolase [Thermomonospora umbrina]